MVAPPSNCTFELVVSNLAKGGGRMANILPDGCVMCGCVASSDSLRVLITSNHWGGPVQLHW